MPTVPAFMSLPGKRAGLSVKIQQIKGLKRKHRELDRKPGLRMGQNPSKHSKNSLTVKHMGRKVGPPRTFNDLRPFYDQTHVLAHKTVRASA